MTFRQFLQRLFPKVFKQPLPAPLEGPRIIAPLPPATTLPSPVQAPPTTPVGSPNVVQFGPLAPPVLDTYPRNGDVFIHSEVHGFVPGTDSFIFNATGGTPCQFSTSEGHGKGFVKVYDSAGNLMTSGPIINGYSSLYYIPAHSDTLKVEVVCDQAGNISQQYMQPGA